MERKNTRHTYEMNIQACKALSRRKSAKKIAIFLNMGKRGTTCVYEWIHLYENGQKYKKLDHLFSKTKKDEH